MKTQPNRMPIIFAGHGSPMNAIEQNTFTGAWSDLGQKIPRPRAILSVSAHWETPGTQITTLDPPPVIYDFYGFPEELYEAGYSAPGLPALAEDIQHTLGHEKLQLNSDWGLDHGTWSVLRSMFPQADIPVLQLSLNTHFSPAEHFRFARELSFLRNQGVLILGSGNIVHNLRRILWEGGAFPWAQEFDHKVSQAIENRDYEKIIAFEKLGSESKLAVPTLEHYLPLLYILGLSDEDEAPSYFNSEVIMGSLSMRGVSFGLNSL